MSKTKIHEETKTLQLKNFIAFIFILSGFNLNSFAQVHLNSFLRVPKREKIKLRRKNKNFKKILKCFNQSIDEDSTIDAFYSCSKGLFYKKLDKLEISKMTYSFFLIETASRLESCSNKTLRLHSLKKEKNSFCSKVKMKESKKRQTLYVQFARGHKVKKVQVF